MDRQKNFAPKTGFHLSFDKERILTSHSKYQLTFERATFGLAGTALTYLKISLAFLIFSIILTLKGQLDSQIPHSVQSSALAGMSL